MKSAAANFHVTVASLVAVTAARLMMLAMLMRQLDDVDASPEYSRQPTKQPTQPGHRS